AWRAGLPTTRAWSGTSAVTTAPAPTMAQRPMVSPDRTVALAPTVAPRRTRVACQPAGPLGVGGRGPASLVKTAPGPRNTLSSTVTPDHSSTPFLIVTPSPTTAPPSTKAWSPTLQSAPTRAPASTWAKAQTRVRGPTSSLSQSARAWTKTEGSLAIGPGYPVRCGHRRPEGQGNLSERRWRRRARHGRAQDAALWRLEY